MTNINNNNKLKGSSTTIKQRKILNKGGKVKLLLNNRKINSIVKILLVN